jgi:hypothetical protein
MTTSQTATLELDIAELIEEAHERAGVEVKNGYDVRTARRSLNLLTMEWANRQVHLWTIEMDVTGTIAATGTYVLPADTIDVLDVVIRTGTGTNQTDMAIKRVPLDVYAAIPNKNTPGRPVQFSINRLITPQIVLWPEPPDDSYTLVIWRMRRIQDTGSTGQLTMDVPFRFIPALVSGLAYYIAMKKPELVDRVQMLKQIYDEQFDLAITEDRERASVFLRPYISR